MQLKDFSLISPLVESGTVLKALETAIPKEAISQALADTHSNEERKRTLPSHLVVCLGRVLKVDKMVKDTRA